MDIGRAFSFVFDDEDWVKKVLVGGLLSLIPVVGGFIVYGYMLEIARRVYLSSTEPLPQWDDIGGYLARGFLFVVAVFVWFLPVILLFGCVTVAIIAGGSASGDDAAAALSGIVAFGLISVGVLISMLWAVAFLPIITGRYAVEQRFGAMFQVGEILADVRRAGAVPILLLLVTYFVAGFIGQLGFLACFIGIIFTSFYANAVVAHGAGQVYRQARGLSATTPGSPIQTF